MALLLSKKHHLILPRLIVWILAHEMVSPIVIYKSVAISGIVDCRNFLIWSSVSGLVVL